MFLLFQWMLGVRFGGNKKNVTADVVCFFVLTPLVRDIDHLIRAVSVWCYVPVSHCLVSVEIMRFRPIAHKGALPRSNPEIAC